MITFTVAGEPFGKKRPRASSFGGHARIHNDPENERYELKVINAYKQQVGDKQFDQEETLSVMIHAWYGIPKSFSKKKQALALANKLRPTKKPDLDNIAKSVLDALNHIAYYDDSQVVTLQVTKYYSGSPRVAITLYAYDDKGGIK